jgi:hypothetical protein
VFGFGRKVVDMIEGARESQHVVIRVQWNVMDLALIFHISMKHYMSHCDTEVFGGNLCHLSLHAYFLQNLDFTSSSIAMSDSGGCSSRIYYPCRRHWEVDRARDHFISK